MDLTRLPKRIGEKMPALSVGIMPNTPGTTFVATSASGGRREPVRLVDSDYVLPDEEVPK